MESSFLSSENSRRNLLRILSDVRKYLNSCGFCTINIGTYICCTCAYMYVGVTLPIHVSAACSPHITWVCDQLCLDETNRLHLKITPTLDEPPTVQDYHVPIFTCTKEDIETITWDLTIEQVGGYNTGICKFLDGWAVCTRILLF